MHLGRKITYAKQHIESVSRHDDAPFVDRKLALEQLKAHLDAELKAAEEREQERAKRALKDDQK